jgi:hypothetical protein
MAVTPGPVPGPASRPGPLQLSRFGSGAAHVQVTGRAAESFDFRLEPSAIQVSPPPRLDLAYGDPATGEGLTIQVPPEQGTIPTSKFSILTLNVDLAGVGALQTTAMHGECSITLDTVGRVHVDGRFACRRLHPNVGSGPTVAATGMFTAQG